MHRNLLNPAAADQFIPALQPVKFVFPELQDRVFGPMPEPPEPAVGEDYSARTLLFDEAEFARAAAAVHQSATEAAKAAARASLDEAMRAATEGLAERIAAFTAAQAGNAGRTRQEAMRLFAALADSCLARITTGDACEAMRRVAEQALADITPATEVTVEVSALLADRFREMVAGTPATTALSFVVVPRSDLAPGDLHLSWRDGWAEWSLDRLRRILAEQLRCHLPDPMDTSAALSGSGLHLPHDLPAE
jgi:hypothetical protein